MDWFVLGVQWVMCFVDARDPPLASPCDIEQLKAVIQPHTSRPTMGQMQVSGTHVPELQPDHAPEKSLWNQ